MDRDLLFTRILFIVLIESGHPENIAFNGRGSCTQLYTETVAQKRRPKHHNGRKNLVNGRSKKEGQNVLFSRVPSVTGTVTGTGNGHDNGHGNGHAICSLFGGPFRWGSMWHWNSCRRFHVLSIAIGLIVRRLMDVEFAPIKVPHCFMDGP